MKKNKFTNWAYSISKINTHTIRLIVLIALLLASLIFPGIAMADPGSGGPGTGPG